MGRRRKYPLISLVLLTFILGLTLLSLWILFPKDYFRLPEATKLRDKEWDYMLHSLSYLSIEDVQQNYEKEKLLKDGHNENQRPEEDFIHCQMETCFNFNRCRDNFKVYVYSVESAVPTSPTYEKILNVITSSPYYTKDPGQACLFVLSIDTLDRDELSRDFVRNVPSRLQKAPFWNNGENHIIFNLYAGTWPLYNETELGFKVGKAILAKASMSVEHFRPNFDISLPLFHGTHVEKGEDLGLGVSNEFPSYKQHLISFKGKRYVYGIGSETRNSVYHLHNKKDVIMVTTCKHGKNWKEMKDDRCDTDNAEYEKYDYETLLLNSTFCLVPRGRRVGSFRFLEALKAGCIPVLVANGWILPFSEVIDWKAATIMGDERTLLQTLDVVRSISNLEIFTLRQQTQVIWNQYLASMEKIIYTTFEIIRDRVERHTWRDKNLWNSVPGALSFDLDYADDIKRFPFHHDGDVGLLPNFTAVIYVESGINGLKSSTLGSYSNSLLFRQVRNAAKSQYISKILIIWDSLRPIPKVWPDVKVPLTIKRSSSKSVSQRFVTSDEIETDAVLSLDEKELLSTDEMDFAYSVWRSFPDRIVGYSTRSHYWDEKKNVWRYSSKRTNDYSMVLASGAMYHVYYNHLYWTQTPTQAQQLVESLHSCEDILLNIIVSRITRKPPIKLTSHKMDQSAKKVSGDEDIFQQRQNCLNELLEIYGSVPFKRSSVRLDPVLFRDPVSNLRKKYRQLEL